MDHLKLNSDRLLDEAYDRSVALLHEVSSPAGFLASSAFDHYAVVWGRDAAITALGALTTDDERLIDTAVNTLRTLSTARSPLGQVAAVARPEDGNWDFGEGGAVDVTAWYVVLANAVFQKTSDLSLAQELWPTVEQAMRWLRYQDVTGTGLLSCAPATDWMDSSLAKSGRTLQMNTLYYWAAKAARQLATDLAVTEPLDPDEIAWRANLLFWPEGDHPIESLLAGQGMSSPPSPFPHAATVEAYRDSAGIDRRHYVSHVVHSLFDENCDVLANVLAICVGLADKQKASRILDTLQAEQASTPFPSKAWLRPITGDNSPYMRLLGAERHIDRRWHNEPWTYHNGGVWPYIGGFHVVALVEGDMAQEAEELLLALAQANSMGRNGERWQFHEWLHAESGEPNGAAMQAWNAGTFVMAWHALEDRTHIRSVFLKG